MTNQNSVLNSYISHFNCRFPELKLTFDELKSQSGRNNCIDKLYNIYEALVYGLSKEDYFSRVSDIFLEETINASRKLQRLRVLHCNLERYSKSGNEIKFHKFFTPDIQLIVQIFKMLESFECVSDAIRDDHIRLTKEYTDEANEKKELSNEITALDIELTDDPTSVIINATNELNELRDEKRKLHDECVDFNTKTSSKRETLHSEGQKVTELRERYEKLEESRKGYEHRYKCEVAKLVNDIDDLMNERQRLTDSEKAVKNDTTILHTKIEQVEDKKKSICELADTNNYLDKEIALAEAKAAEIDKISDDISKIDKNIEHTQGDIVLLKRKIPVLTDYHQVQVADNKNVKKEFKDAMCKLKGEISILYDKFNKIVDIKLEKCSELAKIKEEKKVLELELASLKENTKNELADVEENYNKHKNKKKDFLYNMIEFRKEVKLSLYDPALSQAESNVSDLENLDKEVFFHKKYLQERGERRRNDNFF
uniref:CARD domain-containing protein n=1 Tax=Strongyloides stercoralis TaxID=6248 RepID=A0A0K0DTM8_STRER